MTKRTKVLASECAALLYQAVPVKHETNNRFVYSPLSPLSLYSCFSMVYM